MQRSGSASQGEGSIEGSISTHGGSTISVPAAILAIGSAVAALVFLASLHVLSPEYSPAWRLVSEYANGRYAWVLSLMFGAYGLSSLALAFAVRAQLRSRRGRLGLAALVIAGIGQSAAAVFNLNQVVLHDIAGALGIVALPIGAMLISLELVQTPEWASTRRQLLWAANLTWISVLLWVAGFPLMMATFINAQGALPSSPPHELPPGVIAIVGWTDRLLIVSAWAWIAIVAWNAIRVQRLSASSNADRGSLAARRGLSKVAGDKSSSRMV
jgi:uncharacterized protein DUF998